MKSPESEIFAPGSSATLFFKKKLTSPDLMFDPDERAGLWRATGVSGWLGKLAKAQPHTLWNHCILPHGPITILGLEPLSKFTPKKRRDLSS